MLLLSPGGILEAEIDLAPGGRLTFAVRRAGSAAPVSAPSPLGVVLDGVDIGAEAHIGEIATGERDETYPTRGMHAVARDRHVWAAVHVTAASGAEWTLEARLFDDGFAYRCLVPDEGDSGIERTVTGEASAWVLPADSRVWIAERNNDWKLKSYAGWWIPVPIDDLPTVSSQGPVQAPPLVVELPETVGGGYTAVSEAALSGYSGMRLRAVGNRTVQADFREGADGFTLSGDIVTPWRVLLIAPDLDGLVNSDIWTNLNPPPDPPLFADTSWIRTGRVAWRWWSMGTGTPDEERQFIDYAARLGWEFSLVDDGWRDWPNPWEEIARLCAHGRALGVGVLVWKDYNDEIHDSADGYAALSDFLDRCRAAGVAGVKIDFMNAESLDRIRFQQTALRQTAERRLLLLFHGCQKPTGELRT